MGHIKGAYIRRPTRLQLSFTIKHLSELSGAPVQINFVVGIHHCPHVSRYSFCVQCFTETSTATSAFRVELFPLFRGTQQSIDSNISSNACEYTSFGTTLAQYFNLLLPCDLTFDTATLAAFSCRHRTSSTHFQNTTEPLYSVTE